MVLKRRAATIGAGKRTTARASLECCDKLAFKTAASIKALRVEPLMVGTLLISSALLIDSIDRARARQALEIYTINTVCTRIPVKKAVEGLMTV